MIDDESDMIPGELAGTAREVQRKLRERYGATEANIQVEDVTEWEDSEAPESVVTSKGRSLEFADGDLELLNRDSEVRITLEWIKADLPEREHEPAPVASVAAFLAGRAAAVAQDFPEADVSTYTDGTRGQLNIDLVDP